MQNLIKNGCLVFPQSNFLKYYILLLALIMNVYYCFLGGNYFTVVEYIVYIYKFFYDLDILCNYTTVYKNNNFNAIKIFCVIFTYLFIQYIFINITLNFFILESWTF